MNVLDNNQLALHLPKTVADWDVHDVVLWLKLNDIQVHENTMIEDNINGNKLYTLNPEYWMKKMEISRFIAKRIQQWIQQQSPKFDKHVKVKLGIIEESEKDEDDELSFSDNSDTEEPFPQVKINNFVNQKSIPDSSQKQNYQNNNEEKEAVGKWPKKQKSWSVEEEQNKMVPFFEEPIEKDNPHVKFIKSEFIPISSKSNYMIPSALYDKRLIVKTEQKQVIISQNSKVGRYKANEICLTEESVSRNHAEIVKVKKKNNIKYYIKDRGSRFGTFVQVKTPYPIIENQIYHIAECQFVFCSIKVNSASPQNKTNTFNIKIKLLSTKESILKFQNKQEITIGKKNQDIKLNREGVEPFHARIFIEQKKNCIPILFFEPVDGKIFRKLNEDELWVIENGESEGKVEVFFGALSAQLQTEVYCLNCGSLDRCECMRCD